MKTAFAVWNNRIAPVFDVTRRVIIVDSKLEGLAAQIQATLPDNLPLQKALRLSQPGADKLVCGAISSALQAMLTARGIRVIPLLPATCRPLSTPGIDRILIKAPLPCRDAGDMVPGGHNGSKTGGGSYAKR